MLGGIGILLVGVVALFVFALVYYPTGTSPAAVSPVPAPAPVLAPTASAPALPVSDAGLAPPAAPGDDAGVGAAPTAPGGDAAAPLAATDTGPQVSSEHFPIAATTPIQGARDALVTLVVFGDLQCPHTRSALKSLDKLRRAFATELRIAWRHRPLAQHRHARAAAEVAAALFQRDGAAKFWKLLKIAARGSSDPNPATLRRWGNQVGIAEVDVDSWLKSRPASRAVSEDLVFAGQYGIRSTPTFYVNGKRLEGARSFRELEKEVRSELALARAVLASGTPRTRVYDVRVRKNLIGIGSEVQARACPAVGKSPVRGANNALVTIVEYSDFECPFCKRVQPALGRVLARHGGDVRLVWKNYPLAFHRQAEPAANVAMAVFAAGGHKKFWKAHDLLFASQKSLNEATYKRIATDLGLDPTRLAAAATQQRHAAAIAADMKEGKKLGVRGTPTFFINGRLLSGARPEAEFLRVVSEEIDWAKNLVRGGTPRSRVYDAVCGRP